MLLYCWLLLDVEQPTFGGSRSLLVPDRSRGEIPVASSCGRVDRFNKIALLR